MHRRIRHTIDTHTHTHTRTHTHTHTLLTGQETTTDHMMVSGEGPWWETVQLQWSSGVLALVLAVMLPVPVLLHLHSVVERSVCGSSFMMTRKKA